MYFWLLLLCALGGREFADRVEAQEIEKGSGARIVGGNDATKRYPYQVSIDNIMSTTQMPDGEIINYGHFCGGSIITENHILTAAHCVVDVKTGEATHETKDLSILVGTNKFQPLGGTYDFTQLGLQLEGTRHDVCSVVYHEKYLDAQFNYDIAVITVIGTIKQVPGKVAAIPLSTDFANKGDIRCVITGWGSVTGYGGLPTTDLQELHVTTQSDAICQRSFARINKLNLCTISDGEGEGGCSGDSGGPLVDVKRKTLIGVINSVNSGECATGKPDFYAKVAAFGDWIKEHTKYDSSCEW